MSNLDFTGVIEEHNEVHHRQRLMELPVFVYLKKSFSYFSIFCCRILIVCRPTLTLS